MKMLLLFLCGHSFTVKNGPENGHFLKKIAKKLTFTASSGETAGRNLEKSYYNVAQTTVLQGLIIVGPHAGHYGPNYRRK